MKIEVAELTEQDKKERNLPKVTFSFSRFKNLKIAINDQQPLDEVVRELESKGLRKVEIVGAEKGVNIYVDSYRGEFFEDGRNLGFYVLTTLAELKEM